MQGLHGMILKHTQCLMQLELVVCCLIVFSGIAATVVWQMVCMFVAFKALHSVANILNFFEKFIHFYEMMTVIIKLESLKYRHIFT